MVPVPGLPIQFRAHAFFSFANLNLSLANSFQTANCFQEFLFVLNNLKNFLWYRFINLLIEFIESIKT